MKQISLILISIVMGMLPASAKKQTKYFEFGDITSIYARSPFRVHITQGSSDKVTVVYDDEIEKSFKLTAIGNGQFCGGGFRSAPRANISDGMFDVCAIDKVSLFKFLTLVGSYKKGTYLTNKRALEVINYRRESHFKMEFDEPIAICVDGEIKGAKTIDFTCIPNGVNFVIPKGCEYKFKD